MKKLASLLLLLFSMHSAWAADVFGARMFTGTFQAEQFTGFNPNYQIMVGDKITLRLWGAVTFEGALSVDPQGNIFIQNVGPIAVAGTRNSELNDIIATAVRRVYHSNVGVYAALDAAQPVKVFVTGNVQKPGLYGGLASNSVLYYLDRAGGVDVERGSFIKIRVMRGDMLRYEANLYDFLLTGKLDLVQFVDGDTIVVMPRGNAASFAGEVANPYQFEFQAPEMPLKELLALARPKAAATYVSIVRIQGTKKTTEYHPIDKIDDVILKNGDEVSVLADKYPGTILVRVEGAHSSQHAFVLTYGAKLKDVLKQIVPNEKSNLKALQLFRKSVAIRQKENLAASLRALETSVLTARSATSEESSLRVREAELVMKFIERAKDIQPTGQVVLGSTEGATDTLLEDGDVIRIPEITSLVTVSGEVMFPNAILHRDGKDAGYYIDLAGGYTQSADTAKLLVLHQNGVLEDAKARSVSIVAGDELLVLPQIDTKNIEVTRGITQILYQIAIAARALVAL